MMPILTRLGSEDWVTRLIEFIIGAFLTIMCILTLNPTLLAFALAILLGPVLFKVHWDMWLLRPVLYTPSVLICIGFILTGTDVLISQGIFMCVFPFHF